MIDRILERLEEERKIAEKEMEKCIFKGFPYHDSTEGKVIGIKKTIEIVQEVAKEYGWVSVKDRLPEEIMKDCLVTLENGAVFQAQYVKYKKEFRIVAPYHGIIPFHEDNPVIAWCELPAPYQKGE